MMLFWVYFIFFLFVGFLIVLMWISRRFRNPYKLYFVVGGKGSGKTTTIAKKSYIALKNGKPVYSTESVPGTKKFNVDKVGKNAFPDDSVVFIDEAGMKYDSRDFKSFPKHVRDYFKYQRHEKNTVWMFSQSFDVDKKIRDLTDGMYLMTCHFNVFSVARRFKKNFKIVEATSAGESRLAENYEFEPIWLALFGVPTLMITFIPRWAHLFDSHERLGLPAFEADDLTDIPIPDAASDMYYFATGKDKPNLIEQIKFFYKCCFGTKMKYSELIEALDNPMPELNSEDLPNIDIEFLDL